MIIAVLGGTGFVGQRLVRKALAAGHGVRALVRRPEALGDVATKVEAVRGEMADGQALAALVTGVDAVICLVGPPRQGKHDSAPHEAAMRALVAATRDAGVKRIVTVAGAAARLPGESLGARRSLLRFVLERLVMPDVIRTKDLEVRAVVESGLDWTIVRPPRIGRGRPSGSVKATDTDLAGTGIDVEDMAAFLLSLVETGAWIRRAPTVASA